MSDSYKKVPIIKYGGYGKYGKHLANKKVRNNDIGNYGNYKKLYDRFNIFDWVSNLYRIRKRNGIPIMRWQKKIMTIEEINEYWKK